MDLDVELDSSKSSGRFSVVRKSSATDRASSMLPDPNVSAQDPTSTVSGRKQNVTRRSSINSNSSSRKQSVEPSEADSEQSSQKRCRKSRQISVESDSPMFAKPTSSTRTRHLVSRRYSPSPDTRPGAKLKNLVAKIQEKEKQGRLHDKEKQGKKKLEFALTKLPTDYDSISIILLGNLRFEPIDFQLPRGIEKRIREAAVVPQEIPVVNPPPILHPPPILQPPPSVHPPPITATKAKTTTASRSSAKARKEPVVKEEVLSVQSSDDEDDKEVAQPVVRMADIGAAPFTPAPVVVASPPAMVAKPRRKPRSSAPVIKLPRRRTIDVPIRMDMSEKSSTASVSSAEDIISAPMVTEKRRRRPSKRVENANAPDTSLLTSSSFLPEQPAPAPKPTTEPKKGRRHTIVPIAVPVEIPMIDAGVPSESTSKDASVEEAPIENTSVAVSQSKGNRAKGKRRRLSDPAVFENEPSKSTDVARAKPAAKRPKRISTEETAELMAEVLERRKVLGKRSATKRVSLIETPSTSSTTSEYVPSSDSRGASPIRPVPQHTAKSVGKEDQATVDTAKSSRPAARVRTSIDDKKESIDEKPSSSVTPESNDSIKESSDPSTSKSSTEVKITRKHSSVTVKAAGAGKVRISSSVVESASLTSKSPSLLSVRRSSRSHTLTKKMLDSDLVMKTGLATPTISKPVDPNSALGILQRVSRFTRPIRSPSPQPLPTVLPHPSEPAKEVKSAAAPTAETIPEAEKPIEKDAESVKTVEISTDKETASSSRDTEESVDAFPATDSKPEVPEKKPEDLASTTTALAVSSVPLVSETQAAESKEKSISPTQPSPKISRAEEATTVTSGRSSRVVRPSSRFVNPDFVSPIRRRKSSSSAGTKVEVAKRKDSKAATAAAVPLEEPVMSPTEKPEYISPVAATHLPEEPAPTTSSEKTVKPAPVVTPVHTMETRRRSLKKARPIKIKLRLGCFPRVIAVNTGSDVKTDEPEASKPPAPAPVAIVKKPAKRYISPWSHYVPSVKPVLGNVYYSDGTVEKLGVSVNAVMDRLLLEVCKDGITRHSAIVNKREKRRRNIEKARERVARLKKEREEREAQGWIMRQQKASHHIEPRAESPRHELGPRHRGGLLQKDFLYPSLKRGTKAEKKKKEELRKARSRRVMSQLAESTYDEAERPVLARRGSAPSKAVPAKIPRPREPSPFDPQKEERLRLEAEERERQKRLTMPISFNTFLSSKTSVLVAQPLLQPQRISDRAPVADHFYRELLCEYNSPAEAVEDSWNDFDMDVEDSLDVTTIEAVHIPKFDDYVAPPVLDESAEPVATQVEQLLLRPSLYAEEDGISYLYERALEQPELRRNLLTMAIDCISALHVARLSACGREAAIVVYNTVTHQASKMRDVICMFSREREEAVFWMHRYLIEMLPVELLASYLFLLRHTRLLNCQVKSIVRSTQNESSPWPEVTKIIGKYVEENVVEPDAADLERTIAIIVDGPNYHHCLQPASLSDVVFVLVAPNVTVGDFSVRDRFYDSVFKWLREIGHPSSTILKIKIDENYSTAVGEMVLTAVNMISRLVTKMVREHRQKRIVLVGWSTTCCFNHMVLSAVPGVSAIIDLAFPVLSLDGPRGEPDDDILLTYCPSLFVVGAQACDYHPAAMKMMRSSMIMPSGLVVIGHANNNLLVSCSTLSRLRITQKVVSRCIVEQICDFLGMEWTKRERSRLVPMPLNDIFKVDLTQLKLDEKAAQASKKPKDEGTVRKKKLSGTPLQSPIPRETSPSPLPISSLDSVRSNFQSLLKKAGIEKTTRPEERQLLSGSFKEPRLPVKPMSEMDSPVPRTDSPNLLDPASISLI